MKTKRDLIAIVGIVLFVLAFAITGSYNDSISGGGDDGEDAQYKDIVDDIDETLIKTYSNVDKIEYLDAELEKHKNDLKDILDEYASLDKGIKKESIYIEEIGKEINDTRADSDKLKEKRIKLQAQIDGEETKTQNIGNVKVWMFYLSLFISANLFIWFEISTYYRNRKFYA